MSQSWFSPWSDTGQSLPVVMASELPATLDSLRTKFSGSTEPLSPVAYQDWADTTTGLLKRRNGGNTDWVTVGALEADAIHQLAFQADATITGAGNHWCGLFRQTALVTAVYLVSSGTTSGSDVSNFMTFQLFNNNQGLGLFSTLPTTFAGSGIGGGSDVVAFVQYVFIPDQNQGMVAGDGIEMRLTVTGTPTISLTRPVWVVEYIPT